MTENLESNIRDQTGEDTFYYHWFTLDLSGKSNFFVHKFLGAVHPRKIFCNSNLINCFIIKEFFGFE